VLRILPVEEETRKLPVFDVTLSINGLSAAIGIIESSTWEENTGSVTSTVRILAEQSTLHHSIKRSDFIAVEPFPGDANLLTKKMWLQFNTLLIGDLIQGEGPIWQRNLLLSTLIVGVGAYGRASDRGEGGRALAFLNEILKEVPAVVKQTANLKREVIISLARCRKVPPPIAVFPCSLAEAVEEISFGASMGSGRPNAVLARLTNVMDAFPLLSAVCAQATDVPGAVIRLAKAFGHPDSIVFNTLESINEQLGDHRDLVMGDRQGAAEVPARAAAIIDQVEQRIRAARNFDRANASSGLADPNAAKLEITTNQAILNSPSLQALAVAVSDVKLSSEMRIHMIMKSREVPCVKAFYDRRTPFSLSPPCAISAKAYLIGVPYIQWACTHDENGVILPRCGGALFQLSSSDVDRLTQGKLSTVNWAAIGAAFCRLKLPSSASYDFPSTVGEMVHVVDLYFPVFKRIFIALGFAPEVFDEFESSIVTLLQNTLPGSWLTGLINDAFNAFMEEKTNELVAFISTSSFALAVFPGVPDEHARSSVKVAQAITRGDESIRMRDQQSLSSDSSVSPHLSQAPPSIALTASSVNSGTTNGAAPGGRFPKQKSSKGKNAPVASPVTAPIAAPTAATPGRRVLPGSCTSLVKKNAAETLLKIGKSDVFDAEQLVADVRARSPSFNIDLKRDILLLAAWLAEGSDDQRARFVPAGCDRRFIGYPFSPFDKQAYITNKNF
jgi:hypothetical protein